MSIFRFGSTTYFGYDRHGGVAGLAAVADAVRDGWDRSGEVPGDLRRLRAALFFEARRWHHYGSEPDPAAETYVRALLEGIRRLSGGSVRSDQGRVLMRLRRALNRLRRDA